MHIAICDDSSKCIEELKSCVLKYFAAYAQGGPEPEIVTFQAGASLLEAFTRRGYDIVFLDIDMPGINGMELSTRIRQLDTKVQISFVTYMEQHLPFGYRVKASGFVIKPFTQERINSVLHDMMLWIKAGQRQPLEIKLKGGGVALLETRDIMYIESFKHYVEAVCKDGHRFEFLEKISILEIMLSDYHFARIHRSYLVNLDYVFIRSTSSVRLTSGEELPIGRSYSEKFKALYEDYRRGKSG